MRRITARIIFILILGLALYGCESSIQKDNAVTGDKLFIPEGYQAQLASLKLTEIASLPHFTKPFICVLKNADGQQFAVVFHTADKFETVKLPISYEDIIKRIEAQGFQIELGTWTVQNLHLFEINHHLFWNFSDGTGTIYLNLKGEVVADPFKSTISSGKLAGQ